MDLFKQIKFEKLPLKNLIVFCFFVNLVTILISLLAGLILPPQIPLFFGLPQTEEVLADSFFLIMPSFIAMIITLLNSYLAIKIEGIYIKKSLAFATFAISLLSFITTIKIIFLVGSI